MLLQSEAGDAPRKDCRLARACAGDHQHRPMDMGNRLQLSFVGDKLRGGQRGLSYCHCPAA